MSYISIALETELNLAKAKYLKCLKKFKYEEGLVNQLSAIRNALDKAHEIQLETQLQQGFC